MSTLKPRINVSTVWASTNPILKENETGIESDTGKMKIGDSLTNWNLLEYIPTNTFFADTSFFTHTGTTSLTLLGSLVIPANTIKNNDVWEVEVVASKGGMDFSHYTYLQCEFNGVNFISNVSIGNGSRVRIRISRSMFFKDGKLRVFANSGAFFTDYGQFQSNNILDFNFGIEHKLKFYIASASAIGVAYFEYIIFKKIN